MTDDLTDLNPCPLCGGAEGYFLGDGETYRWWDVAYKACGESVTECRADPHMSVNREPPPARHPNADAAWQGATKHYAMVCANVDRLTARVAALEAERDAERARADMHADLGRRTAEALCIEGDRSGMPEVAAALRAERDAAIEARKQAQLARESALAERNAAGIRARAEVADRMRALEAENAALRADAERLDQHQRRWVENRGAILTAIEDAGLMLVSNQHGWALVKRPGHIDAARTPEADR